MIKVKRALISVSDKSGIDELALFLQEQGVEVISTGGTANRLAEVGVSVTPIEKVTGNPEAFGGRMKTISFQIASSLLFRRELQADIDQAEKLGIVPIDLVICNLYPFKEVVQSGADLDTVIENIDIGGPTMIRAAAKNHRSVVVCTKIEQYQKLIDEIAKMGGVSEVTAQKFAVEAFQLTNTYDALVSQELDKRYLGSENMTLNLYAGKTLRYGENPHQTAKIFQDNESADNTGIAKAKVIQGKELSYNNYVDADAAYRIVSDAYHVSPINNKFVVSIVKHANPCGLAVSANRLESLELAWAGDPVSAFGSIISFSGSVDESIANWLSDKFVEVLVAPKFTSEALRIFSKKKNLRLLEVPIRELEIGEKLVKSISGGFLLQTEDEGFDINIDSVTKAAFPEQMVSLARFGLVASKHLKSNAVALVCRNSSNAFQLVGAGMGQPNRVDCLALLAGPRSKNFTDEKILVSDAFFPFDDIVKVANQFGIKYLVQPGGSRRDQEVIDACDELGIAMLMTGRRHFRH